MAAGPWIVYNDFIAASYKATMDLHGGDTIAVMLVTSLSNAINKAMVNAFDTNVTHEVANGNGYTTGGKLASGATITGGGATATITFDTADVAWTGSGAGFSARAAVMYDANTDNLIAYCLLDATPADVTFGVGDVGTINIAGVFNATH